MKHLIVFLFCIIQLSLCSCSSSDGGGDEDDPILSLKFDKTTLSLNVGDVDTITIIETPEQGQEVIWTSSDEDVATVFFGKVTALTSGSTTITATVGEDTATCEVTVAERTYQLVWSDEFDGDALDTDIWTYEIGTGSWGWGNNEEQYYTDRTENIRLEDGMLVIEARKESYEGSEYTSARIKTADKKDFKYGKIEARLRVPAGTGTWPALWMLGYGSWPQCGEIDIMEHVGKDPMDVHCALHTTNKNGMNGNNFSDSSTFSENMSDDFHVITLEWVEKEIQGYDRIYVSVDGEQYATFGETSQLQESDDWPFNDSFYFILNLAIGGNWGGDVDDSMFDVPVLYQIDYVRVYQLQ